MSKLGNYHLVDEITRTLCSGVELVEVNDELNTVVVLGGSEVERAELAQIVGEILEYYV